LLSLRDHRIELMLQHYCYTRYFYAIFSSGLKVHIPATAIPKVEGQVKKENSKSRSRTRSPRTRRRRSRSNRSRSRSRSRSPRRHRSSRRRSRSVHRIPRSPTNLDLYYKEKEKLMNSKSNSPSKTGRSTLDDDIDKFLSKTNSKRRSISPAERHGSSKRTKRSKSRSKRSRSRSKSPLAIKKDNKVFCEKLALTAEGKWNSDLEGRWKLMEAEEAMYAR